MLVCPKQGRYTHKMSRKIPIEEVADRFFQLWQQQVTLLAQSPSTGFEDLMADGKRIAEEIALATRKEQTEKTDMPDGDREE